MADREPLLASGAPLQRSDVAGLARPQSDDTAQRTSQFDVEANAGADSINFRGRPSSPAEKQIGNDNPVFKPTRAFPVLWAIGAQPGIQWRSLNKPAAIWFLLAMLVSPLTSLIMLIQGFEDVTNVKQGSVAWWRGVSQYSLYPVCYVLFYVGFLYLFVKLRSGGAEAGILRLLRAQDAVVNPAGFFASNRVLIAAGITTGLCFVAFYSVVFATGLSPANVPGGWIAFIAILASAVIWFLFFWAAIHTQALCLSAAIDLVDRLVRELETLGNASPRQALPLSDEDSGSNFSRDLNHERLLGKYNLWLAEVAELDRLCLNALEEANIPVVCLISLFMLDFFVSWSSALSLNGGSAFSGTIPEAVVDVAFLFCLMGPSCWAASRLAAANHKVRIVSMQSAALPLSVKEGILGIGLPGLFTFAPFRMLSIEMTWTALSQLLLGVFGVTILRLWLNEVEVK